MKKTYLTLIILALYVTTFAQVYSDDDSKEPKGPVIEKTKKDEFTGLTTSRTSIITLLNKGKHSVFALGIKVDDLIWLNLRVMTFRDRPFLVTKKDVLYLKLANDDVVKLHPSEDVSSCKGCGNNGTYAGSGRWGATISFALTPEQLKQLTTQKTVKLSLRCEELPTIEEDIAVKRQETIKMILTLLRQ